MVYVEAQDKKLKFGMIFLSKGLSALYPLMGRSESLKWWSLFWFRAIVNGRICPWIIAQDQLVTKRGKRVILPIVIDIYKIE